MKKSILLLIMLFAVMTATTVAEIPTTLNLQGYLVDATGEPVAGNVALDFELWDAETAGTSLYKTTIAGGIDVVDGYYNIRLGLPGGIAGIVEACKNPLWYELTIGGIPQGRVAFDAVPYSVGSKFAETADSAKPIGPAGGILTGTYPNPEIDENVLSNVLKNVIVSATPMGEARGKEIQGKFPDDLVIANRAVQTYHIALNAVKTAQIDTGAVTLDRLAKPADETINNLIWWNKDLTSNFKWQHTNLGNVLGGSLTTGYVPIWDAINDKFINSSISEVAGQVDVNADLKTTGNLEILGTTTLTTLNAGATTVTDLTVTGNETIAGTLGVTGATTLNNTLTVADNYLTDLYDLNVRGLLSLNDVLVGGTLEVTGATTLNDALNVVGATTLSELSATTTTVTDLTVTGNETVAGTFDVTGTTTLTDLTVTGNETVTGTLGVTGTTTLTTLNAGATTVTDLTVTGNETIAGTLGVTGATTLNNTLGVTGATTLGNTLTVTGASIFNNGITVNGATTNINAGLLVDGASYNAAYANTLLTNKYMPAGATDQTFTTKKYVDDKTNIVLTSEYVMPTTTFNPNDATQKQLTNSQIYSRTDDPWDLTTLGYNYGTSSVTAHTYINNSVLFTGNEIFLPTGELNIGQGPAASGSGKLNIAIDGNLNNTGISIFDDGTVMSGSKGFIVDLSTNGSTDGIAGYFATDAINEPTLVTMNINSPGIDIIYATDNPAFAAAGNTELNGAIVSYPDITTLADVKNGAIFTLNADATLADGWNGQIIYIINTDDTTEIVITGNFSGAMTSIEIPSSTASSFIFVTDASGSNGVWYPVK